MRNGRPVPPPRRRLGRERVPGPQIRTPSPPNPETNRHPFPTTELPPGSRRGSHPPVPPPAPDRQGDSRIHQIHWPKSASPESPLKRTEQALPPLLPEVEGPTPRSPERPLLPERRPELQRGPKGAQSRIGRPIPGAGADGSCRRRRHGQKGVPIPKAIFGVAVCSGISHP